MCASDQLSFKPEARAAQRMRAACLVLAAAVLSWGVMPAAHAASDRDQEQVRRLKLQMRQIQQEQADAQAKVAADKAEMETSVKQARSEAAATKAAAAQNTRRLASLNSELQSLRDEKTSLQTQLADLQKKLDEQKVAAQAQSDEARTRLTEQKGQYEALQGRQAQCSKDNAELYQVGQDLLARYEDKGLAEVLYAKEPVMQLGRVKLENLAAQYRERLDAGRTQP